MLKEKTLIQPEDMRGHGGEFTLPAWLTDVQNGPHV